MIYLNKPVQTHWPQKTKQPKQSVSTSCAYYKALLYTKVMDLPNQPISPTPTPVVPPTPSSPLPPPPPPPIIKKKSKFLLIILPIILVVILVLIAGFFVGKKIISSRNASKSITLTYWGLWEPKEIIQPLIDAYESSHPNVKINYIFQSQREYRERLQNALSQGQGPDVFRIHSSWIPMFKQDLSPVPATVYSASEYESLFYPTTKTDLRVGNNYVAVPLEIDGLALFVNDNVLTQSGKTVPASWDELRQTAYDLCVGNTTDGKCRPGDKILVAGVAMGTADNVDHWQDILVLLMLQNNVNLNSPSGKIAEDALDYYTQFSRVDHVWDSTLPSSTENFASGKLAFYFGPSWRVFDILNLNPSLKFSVHPVPQAPLDLVRGEKPVNWASYWAEGVNVKSVHKDAAWEFVKYLSSSESLQKLYSTAALTRAFGEPYGRTDLAVSIKDSPYVGAYISQAPTARSWYLASNTFDGPTGINTLLSKYFSDAVNKVNQGSSPAEAIKTLSLGITQVLSRYGLAAVAPQSK